MPDIPRDPIRPKPALRPASPLLRLGIVGAVPLCLVAAFAYTGGWFSPHRLTQDRIISTFEQQNGKHAGFRRNHSKGMCATGWFESNGNAVAVSKANLFAPGRVPVVGRFAFAGGMPFMADKPATVRSLALRFLPAHGEEWRTGMINIPIFPVDTPQTFYEQLIASKPDPATGKPDPEKMKAFAAAHPNTVAPGALIKARKVSSGFADSYYNGLDTFRFINAAGTVTPVRWSVLPVQPVVAMDPAAPPPAQDGMFDALIAQVVQHPVQWRLVLTLGQAGDPDAPNLPWPADRQQVDAGTVTLSQVQSEDGGPCTDVNYDPTVLPDGIETSTDAIPSARSSSYARSFRLREGERNVKSPSAVKPQDIASGGKS
ncbi:MAG: catalase family peroxidase [Janthinobacterium lividum]